MRKRYSDEERSKILGELRRSGLGVKAFAKSRGVSGATLYQWLSRDGRQAAMEFARVVPRGQEGGQGKARVVIEVGAARVYAEAGFDAELLRGVIDALSGPGRA